MKGCRDEKKQGDSRKMENGIDAVHRAVPRAVIRADRFAEKYADTFCRKICADADTIAVDFAECCAEASRKSGRDVR